MVYNSRSHSPQYRTKMIKKLIFSAFILLLAPLFHAASAADASKVAKESVSKNSMMPPGLVNNLSLEEFASLVDYLQSLH